MALKSFKLDPFHTHTYVSVKEVELIKITNSDPKLEDELGTSLIKESNQTGKPE
jgi:hypothetical protein